MRSLPAFMPRIISVVHFDLPDSLPRLLATWSTGRRCLRARPGRGKRGPRTVTTWVGAKSESESMWSRRKQHQCLQPLSLSRLLRGQNHWLAMVLVLLKPPLVLLLPQ